MHSFCQIFQALRLFSALRPFRSLEYYIKVQYVISEYDGQTFLFITRKSKVYYIKKCKQVGQILKN